MLYQWHNTHLFIEVQRYEEYLTTPNLFLTILYSRVVSRCNFSEIQNRPPPTVYFQFYDTAKTDYIATVCKGVDWERLAIVVVKIEAEFVSQIKGDDHIAGRTRIVKIGNKSFHLEQDVIDTDTQEVKSRCLSVMVLYDLERQQTIPLPDEWRKAISDFEGL